MKYLVVSDIHGSYYYAKKLEQIIMKENPSKIILLGDLYYHGPRNSLTDEYNPMKVSKILNKYKDNIICTRGNCDAEVDEMISEFKFEEYIQININGLDFFFSHGHIYNIDKIPPIGDIIVYGHFHTGYIKEKDGLVFVNPGSISLPKNNTAHSYLIIDNNELILKDIDGKVIEKKNRIERDIFINKLFNDLEIDLLRYPVYNTYYKETLKKRILENIKEHYYED